MDYSSLYTNITNVTYRMADTAAFVHHLQHSSLNRQQREREKKKKTLAQIGKHIVLDRDDPGFQAGAGDKRKKKKFKYASI